MTSISSDRLGCDVPAAQPTKPPKKRRKIMNDYSNDSKILEIIEKAAQFHMEYRPHEEGSTGHYQKYKKRLWENIYIGIKPDACEDHVERAAKSLATLTYNFFPSRTRQANAIRQQWEAVDKGIRPFATKPEQIEASNELKVLLKTQKLADTYQDRKQSLPPKQKNVSRQSVPATALPNPQPVAPNPAFSTPFNSPNLPIIPVSESQQSMPSLAPEPISSFDAICPKSNSTPLTVDEDPSLFVALQTPFFAPSPEPFPDYPDVTDPLMSPLSFFAPSPEPFPNNPDVTDPLMSPSSIFVPSPEPFLNYPNITDPLTSPLSMFAPSPEPFPPAITSTADETTDSLARQPSFFVPNWDQISHAIISTADEESADFLAPDFPNAMDLSTATFAPSSGFSQSFTATPYHFDGDISFTATPYHFDNAPFFSIISKASRCTVDERIWDPKKSYNRTAIKQQWRFLDLGVAKGASEEIQIRAAESLIALTKTEMPKRQTQKKLWTNVIEGIASGASFEQQLQAAKSLKILIARRAQGIIDKKNYSSKILKISGSTSTKEPTPIPPSAFEIIKTAQQCPIDEHVSEPETISVQKSRWKALTDGITVGASKTSQTLAAKSLVALAHSKASKAPQEKGLWADIKKGILSEASPKEQLEAARSLDSMMQKRVRDKKRLAKHRQRVKAEALASRSSTSVKKDGISPHSASE